MKGVRVCMIMCILEACLMQLKHFLQFPLHKIWNCACVSVCRSIYFTVTSLLREQQLVMTPYQSVHIFVLLCFSFHCVPGSNNNSDDLDYSHIGFMWRCSGFYFVSECVHNIVLFISQSVTNNINTTKTTTACVELWLKELPGLHPEKNYMHACCIAYKFFDSEAVMERHHWTVSPLTCPCLYYGWWSTLIDEYLLFCRDPCRIRWHLSHQSMHLSHPFPIIKR